MSESNTIFHLFLCDYLSSNVVVPFFYGLLLIDKMLGNPGQNQLLTAIFCNHLEEITTLLQNNDDININHVYGGPFNKKTVLEIACCEFISTIKQSTIKLLIENGAEGQNALYYAACECNEEIVKELLKNKPNLKEDPILILLIKYINSHNKNEENYLNIVKNLLEKVEINLEDESGYTAIYLAAKFGYKLMIDLILNLKDKEIDLDSCTDKIYKTARDLIQSTSPRKFPELVNKIPAEITLKVLLKNICQRQETEFLRNYHKFWQNNTETINEDNNILLLFAAEKGLINIVRYFLYIGVDSNRIFMNVSDKYVFPLKYACVRGHFNIVELLLQYSTTKTVNISMIELVKTKFEDNEIINHKRCLELLLENTNIDLTFRDESKNTVCHYAAMYQASEIILMLLKKGGSLACKNNIGKMTIEFLDSKTLEKHFDDCILFVSNYNAYIPRHLVEINFKSMLPEKIIITDDEVSVETNILQYISTQNELKHLLHHPVIDMFLFLKWQRVKHFILLNLIVYIMFMVFVFIFIYTKTVTDPDKIPFKWFCSKLVKVGLTVLWLFLIFREIIQIFVFRKEYFKQYENWIEICLFCTTGVLLFKSCPSSELKNQLSALIIVTSSVELMLLSGRQFRIFFVSSMVLQTVSTTLFKWLSSYIILIVSFSFGFYYIFHGQRFFQNIYISLFKTIVMITGEFELENFKFADNYLIGPLLFILFVFLVNIVLLGVCTALAINDIQLIINDAETKMQIVQIQHIVYWEITLYTSRMYHFSNWFQKILKIKLLQEEPIIKIRVEDNYKGFQIVNHHDRLEIDSKIVQKIIAKNEISNKYNNKDYPTLNEKFFFELRKTLNADNYSVWI